MTGAAAEDYDDRDGASSADLVVRTKAKARETITVTLDGHPLVIHQPKSSVLAELLRRSQTGDLRDLSDEEAAVRIEAAQAASDELMEKVFDPKAAKHLRKRLADEDDEFDTEDMSNIWKMLVQRWSPRPTGSPSGSRKSKARSGRRTTVRSH